MNVLILGGNSDIGFAIGEIFAQKQNANILLASRDQNLLQKKAQDIATRFQVKTHALPFDATDYASHEPFYQNLPLVPDIVVVAFGYMCTTNQAAEQDFNKAKRTIDTNLTGAISILEIIAKDFEKRHHGGIIGIGSVAGCRGRAKNYIYGASKAGFSTYLSGLRSRLVKSNIHVMTVLPGFIATKLIAELNLPDRASMSPESMAKVVYKTWNKKRNIIYVPWIWRWIMLIVNVLPEFIFKKTKF